MNIVVSIELYLYSKLSKCQGLFDLPDEGRKLKAEEHFSASKSIYLEGCSLGTLGIHDRLLPV
jgi:hypothetical protein